jgi:hypothetical protein
MSKENTKIEQCKFVFKCPKTWGNLERTNVESVRFCVSCGRNVYLSVTSMQLKENEFYGRCVAIPVTSNAPDTGDIEESCILGLPSDNYD